MRILIDGDSCCVMSLTERVAYENGIECHIYSDTSRIISPEYNSIVHTVDKGPNSVDFAITNNCCKDDIVVTSDVSLAALILAKKGIVLSPYGIEFTNENIMTYLNRKFVRTTAARKQARPVNTKGLGTSKEKHNYKKALTEILRRTTVACSAIDA